MMNPIKKNFCTPLAAVALGIFGTSLIQADTVKLKNGTVLEGTILESQSTAETLAMEVRKGGIKDNQKIPRTEILEMVKLGPDEVEFAKWGEMNDTQDRMSTVEYETIIRDKFEAFLKQYPNSKLAKEVTDLKDQYTKEMQKVRDGWLQLDNRWIDPKEMDWNKYMIESRLLVQDLKVAATKVRVGDPSNHGLEKFYETLHRLEKEYLGSTGYAESQKIYGEFLAARKVELDRAQTEAAPLIKKRDEDRKGLTADQLKVVEDQKKADELTRKDLNTRFKSLTPRIPLLVVDMLDTKSLSEASRALETEMRAAVNKTKPESLKLLADASEAIGKAIKAQSEGSSAVAYELMDKALSTDNKMKGDTKLKAMLASMKSAADAAKKAPTSTSSIGTGSAANQPGKVVSGGPSSSSLAGSGTVKPTTPAAATGTATPTTPVKKIGLPKEESGPGKLIAIVGGAAAVIIGLLMAMGKKKKKGDDE